MKYLETVALDKLDKTPYEDKKYLPTQSGIYIVAVETHDDFEIIYVGRAKNIRNRHWGKNKHHRASQFSRLVKWLRRSPGERPELPGRMAKWSAEKASIDGELVILYDLMPVADTYNNELELIDKFRGPLNVEGIYPKLIGFDQAPITNLSGDQPEDYSELDVPEELVDWEDDEIKTARGYARTLNYRIKVLSDGGGLLENLIDQWEPDGKQEAEVIDEGDEKPFDCNCLCGMNIYRVYRYRNPATENNIFVGSECVRRFRGEIGTVEMQLMQQLEAKNEWKKTSKSQIHFMLDKWGLSDFSIAKYLDAYLEFVASPNQGYMFVEDFKKAAVFYGFLVGKFNSGIDADVNVTANSNIQDFSLDELRDLYRAMSQGTGISKTRYENQSIMVSSRSQLWLDEDNTLYLMSAHNERIELKRWRVGKAIKELVKGADKYEFNSLHLMSVPLPKLTVDRDGYSIVLDKKLRQAIAKGLRDPQKRLYPANKTGVEEITLEILRVPAETCG